MKFRADMPHLLDNVLAPLVDLVPERVKRWNDSNASNITEDYGSELVLTTPPPICLESNLTCTKYNKCVFDVSRTLECVQFSPVLERWVPALGCELKPASITEYIELTKDNYDTRLEDERISRVTCECKLQGLVKDDRL